MKITKISALIWNASCKYLKISSNNTKVIVSKILMLDHTANDLLITKNSSTFQCES